MRTKEFVHVKNSLKPINKIDKYSSIIKNDANSNSNVIRQNGISMYFSLSYIV